MRPWHHSCHTQAHVANRAATGPTSSQAGDALPLAAASERLRGAPGFPRHRGRPSTRQSEEAVAPPVSPVAVAARLLDVDAAAAYLGVSPWTIRDLDAAGTL